MNQKLFSRDFTLVVIGQIISLFGNAALRFALPLYLLNLTGSPALLGTVTACALLPSIVLSPLGGIVADRVNKRNIMVTLDFFTSALILGFSLCLESGQVVWLLTATLMLLYGIAGAYQPSVQASIPVLVRPERLIAANSVINMVGSFSSLLGPALGGLLYSIRGLKPVLWVCAACFFLSAVMEIFIRIPFVKRTAEGKAGEIVRADFAESIGFIRREKPIIGKVTGIACGMNLFMSAMLAVGMPYLITEALGLEEALASRLYGFMQGAMAAGGLAGGVAAGLLANRLNMKKAGNLLAAAAACLFPAAFTLYAVPSALVNYGVLTVCGFLLMILSTVFTVEMLSFVQAETPGHLIGKVMAVVLTISMCAQPLGNAFYGILLERFRGSEYIVVLLAGTASLAVAVCTKRVFHGFTDGGQREAKPDTEERISG